jgi:hypothetical protein
LASKSSRKKVDGSKTASFFAGVKDLDGEGETEIGSENMPSMRADSLCILLFFTLRSTELKGVKGRSQFTCDEIK